MEILHAVNLEQLGVTGILVAWLMWENHNLRKENSAMMEYTRERDARYEGMARQVIETMQRLEHAFALLKERL